MFYLPISTMSHRIQPLIRQLNTILVAPSCTIWVYAPVHGSTNRSKVEIEGLKRACKRDSVALVQVLSSLEKLFLANGATGRKTLRGWTGGSAGKINSLLLNMTHLYYPVVRRELRSDWGIHIPFIFPIQWGAKELLRVSQLSDSIVDSSAKSGDCSWQC